MIDRMVNFLYRHIVWVILIIFLSAIVYGITGPAPAKPELVKQQTRIETPEAIHLRNEDVIAEIAKLQKAFNDMSKYIGAKEKSSDAKGNDILDAVKSVSNNQYLAGKKLSRIETLIKPKAKPRRYRKRNKYCGPKCRKRRVAKRKAARRNFGGRV